MNDPCPCGSGKKYKNCCLYKNTNKKLNDDYNFLEEIQNNCLDYNALELISTLAGLQLIPENQVNTLQLEEALKLVCSININGDKHVDCKIIERIFGGLFDSLEISLDPLVDVFTDNIDFIGGNYIIYNGIEDSCCHILRNLLFSLFKIKINGLENFQNVLLPSCLSLLTISNEVAIRMKHARYIRSNVVNKKNINYPTNIELSKIRKAVTFSNEEFEHILQQKGLSKEYLKPFILEIGDYKYSITGNEGKKHSLSMFPLIRIGNNIVLGLPSVIGVAIRHFIIKKALLEDFSILNLLNSAHQAYLQIKNHNYLSMFGYKAIELELPDLKVISPLKESVYRFDANKLAYIQLIIDNAEDYTIDDPYGFWDISKILNDLVTRQEEIVKFLIDNGEFKCDKVFVLMIFGCIGREFILHSDKSQQGSRRLMITSENLEIIAHLRDYDRLSLWKFAGALEKLQENTKVINFSLIDLYSIYRNSNNSFYLDDNVKPIFLQIDPGEGFDLRVKAKKIRDIHTVPFEPNSFLTVTRHEEDVNIPIYTLEEVFNGFLVRVVKNFNQPIWIKPHLNLSRMAKECLNLYFEFIEMLSYWLWQIGHSLRPILNTLEEKPIHINIKVDNIEKWIIDEELTDYSENQRFNVEIFDKTIIFEIPLSIKKTLQRNDNLGERIIINELLIAFGNILLNNDLVNTLTDDIRESILETHIPLGQKKKMFLLVVKDNLLLYPGNLPPKRLLQEHDLEEQLDNLIDVLHNKWKSKKLDEKTEQVELHNHIVDIFYDRLKSNISIFNFISLLNELLANYEAIIYHKEFIRLTIPTRIECYLDVEKMVHQIQKERKRIASTSIAIRTLIEIISANPPKGDMNINTDALDKLLAMSYHIINWGFRSDYIHLDLMSYEISFLPSGRIGVKRKGKSYEDNFFEALTYQDIESTIANFEGYFDGNQDSEDVNSLISEINAVSEAEFNFSFVQIKEFIDLLIAISFEQNSCIGRLSLSILKNRLKKEYNWSNNQINTLINNFSLKKRKKWEDPPNGFDNDDIYPWRYNRRLSYIRRPLIISTEPKEDPLVYWGLRNTYESGLQLFKLINTGRYKIKSDSSKEMKEYIGRIKDKIGNEFTKRVSSWLKKSSDWEIHINVEINPNKPLKSTEDLGDIDIFAIDRMECTIYSIECKKINYGRNPREIANEIERLIGIKNFESSWMFKHLEREKWLNKNKNIIKSHYKIDCSDIRINSLILVAAEIITQYMVTPKIPIIAFTKLKREGLKIIEKL